MKSSGEKARRLAGRAQCQTEGAQSTADYQYNANTCINCHANGLIEQNTMYKGADRPNIMKRFFAECSLVLGDMNELESTFDGDMDAFESHLIVKLFDKKFAKEMSQIGGITLDRDAFADYFRGSNGKQLWVDKLSYIVTHSDGTKERKTKLRIWRDYGNAAYSSWMRWFLKSRRSVLSPPTMERSWEMDWRPSSDSSTLSYFGHCQYRPVLEATFLKFVRENMTSHMTGFNRKRNGTVKHMEVPNKNIRDIMDRLAYTNPFIDLEEASPTGQKGAGESDHEDEADRVREPDHRSCRRA